jgi:6-phosphogluconate dehydrogenase
MEMGIVGLGKMGLNMATRLARRGHTIAGTARSPESLEHLRAAGGRPAKDVAELVASLTPPRLLWLMVPAGAVTDEVLRDAAARLSRGDIVVDGGNSNYHDSMRHGEELKAKGIGFLDSGTSGGIWGLENGYCLMVGGEAEHFRRAEPILRDLAPPDGYLHTGPVGSGHFVKMIHNGIEYGMMQAYGEGFEILEKSRFPLDLKAVAAVWNHGSVVRSWLLELLESALGKDPELAGIRGYVEDSGEGRWTVQEAQDLSIPAPVLTLSLQARFRSRQEESFSAKVAAALRNEFGGHAVKKAQ